MKAFLILLTALQKYNKIISDDKTFLNCAEGVKETNDEVVGIV